jgi:6-phosphogluconolactonase
MIVWILLPILFSFLIYYIKLAPNNMLPETIRAFETTDLLAASLGEYVHDISSSAISKSDKFTIAVSGGSLPKILAEALKASEKSGKSFEYSKWHIFYVDERIVALDSADSNHKACHDVIYSQPWFSTPSSQIHTINATLSPSEVANDYSHQISQVFPGASTSSVPSFDCILLGMGPDGHTASLFPSHPLLNETSTLIAFIENSPKPPPQRITFTYPLINHALNVAFVATGASKADAIKSVFDSSIPLDQSLPSARIRQRNTELPVWFVDTAAVPSNLL